MLSSFDKPASWTPWCAGFSSTFIAVRCRCQMRSPGSAAADSVALTQLLLLQPLRRRQHGMAGLLADQQIIRAALIVLAIEILVGPILCR